jgi:AcrR family transcriptional regulator
MAGIRQFDEDTTLARAMDVFWQKSFGTTTMQDLADATGVQRGSLYNAYRDKETIFLLVYKKHIANFMRDIRAALANPEADRALRDFFGVAIKSLTTGEPTRGCLTTKTATDANANSAAIRDALRVFLDDLEQAVQVRLELEDASTRLTLPPADATRLVVTLLRGIIVMERVYADPKRLKKTADSLIKVLFAA